MSRNTKLKKQAQNVSVLYVEDEEGTREQISQILRLFFKNVFIACNGEEGFELFKENNIDLVVTDLTMPKMDGFTMIKEIRKINHSQHIIVLTAQKSSEDFTKTLALGIDGFLFKPINMDKMLNLFFKSTHMINFEKNEK